MENEGNKRVYGRYVEILNTQDFDSLDEVVDPERYKEICVGLTPAPRTCRTPSRRSSGCWSASPTSRPA